MNLLVKNDIEDNVFVGVDAIIWQKRIPISAIWYLWAFIWEKSNINAT